MSSEDTSHSSPKITHDADPDKPQGDPKIDVPSVQSAAVVESETTGVDEKTSTATTTVDATVVGAVTPSSHPLVSTSSEDPDTLPSVPPGDSLKDADDDGSDDDFEADLTEMNWKPRGRTTYPTATSKPPKR